jgi:hypothetical protein
MHGEVGESRGRTEGLRNVVQILMASYQRLRATGNCNDFRTRTFQDVNVKQAPQDAALSYNTTPSSCRAMYK